MKFACRKTMITLLVCFLPTMAMAAEPVAGAEQKPSVQLQPAPQAATAQKPAPPQQATPPATTAAPQLPTEQPKLQLNIPPAANAQGVAKQQPAVLIGYIDPGRISTDSKPGKAGQTKITNKKKKLQAQIEAKRKQLGKHQSEIEAKLPSLSPQQREAASKEFKKKVEEFQKFGQKAENELQELQIELSNDLFEKIQKAASVYAKKTNLSLVVVKREIIYQSEGVVPMDITDEIIKLINEEGPKK